MRILIPRPFIYIYIYILVLGVILVWARCCTSISWRSFYEQRTVSLSSCGWLHLVWDSAAMIQTIPSQTKLVEFHLLPLFCIPLCSKMPTKHPTNQAPDAAVPFNWLPLSHLPGRYLHVEELRLFLCSSPSRGCLPWSFLSAICCEPYSLRHSRFRRNKLLAARNVLCSLKRRLPKAEGNLPPTKIQKTQPEVCWIVPFIPHCYQ